MTTEEYEFKHTLSDINSYINEKFKNGYMMGAVFKAFYQATNNFIFKIIYDCKDLNHLESYEKSFNETHQKIIELIERKKKRFEELDKAIPSQSELENEAEKAEEHNECNNG